MVGQVAGGCQGGRGGGTGAACSHGASRSRGCSHAALAPLPSSARCCASSPRCRGPGCGCRHHTGPHLHTQRQRARIQPGVCVCAVCVGWRGVGWDGVGVGVGRSGAAEVIWLCSPPYDDAPASALRGPINVRLRTSTCATLCLLDVFTLCLRGLRHPLPAWHVAECCLHATRHPLPPAQLTPSSASTTTCATPASCPLPSVQFAGCVGRAFCALC